MAAGFGWIDFSDDQRQKVNAVIELLDSGGTVDELGIGVVRDALADWMFPGISTIQTRPKYFLILLEIFKNYQRKFILGEKMPSLEEYLSDEENRVMRILAQNYNYEEGNGVIGITVVKNNKELARKPSSIYWNGLRIHGLITTHLPRNAYIKSNDLSHFPMDSESRENYEDHFGLAVPNFDVIHDEMTMELNREEALFLKNYFLDTNSHSSKQKHNLLSALLKEKHGQEREVVKKANSFKYAAEALLDLNRLDEETERVIQMALDFDFLIHGAHIRYNILLHNKAGSLSFIQELEEQWENWLARLVEDRNRLSQFDLEELFGSIAIRTGRLTQLFIRNWKNEVLKDEIAISKLDDLVYNQETHKKGAKAKLSLQDAAYDNWVGIKNLEYRFGIVKNIITDLEKAYA